MATTATTLLTSEWTDLGTTPCTVQLRGVGPALLVVATSSPTTLNADALALSKADGSADIGVSGQNVYGRSGEAPGQTTAVVVVR